MSWTPDTQSASDAAVQGYATTVQNTLNALPYYQELETRGIQFGKVTAAQNEITNALANIQAETAHRNTLAQSLVTANQNADTANLGATIGALKPIVDKQKTLLQLRQEQATALANKYSSTFYSSWYPLWFPLGISAPLADTTRVLMYGSTAVLIGVAYLVSSNRSPESESQFGGSRRKNRG
jgi:hypothetical protein